MSDAFWIILTDVLWTAACAFGAYYGVGLIRHSGEAYDYSGGTFPSRPDRESFRLTRVAAVLFFCAVLLWSLLGVIVVAGDAYTWLSPDTLDTDPRSLFYRSILIGGAALTALGLRKLWQAYEVYGPAAADAMVESVAGRARAAALALRRALRGGEE